MLPHDEFRRRVSRLQEMLQAQDIHAALLLMPVDIFYFSGTRQNAALWIPAGGDPCLMVRKSLTRAKEESAIADVRSFPSSRELSSLLLPEAAKVGMTFDALPVQQQTWYSKVLPGREFVDISMLIRELRSVKSPFEIERIRHSAEKLSAIFAEVPTFLKAGMREIDLAAEIEYRLRRSGHEGYVRMRSFNQELFGGMAVSAGGSATFGFFDGAVTGRGVSSAAPQGSSWAEIRPDEPVLIDYVGVFDGYIVDMTRIFVIGTLDPELQRAFDAALTIQEAVRKAMVPGAICEEVYQHAAAMASEAGFGECFMGMPGEQSRFVGHGVGLELDELPVLAQGFRLPLQAGQVVAVEPKFVIPGKGAIGIENTFVVGKAGGIRLTDGLPDDIVVIEP